MRSRVAYYFAAFVAILMLNMVFLVRGQCTIQGCGNGESSIGIVEEIQSFRDLAESVEEMKSQLHNLMRSLQAIDRRLNEHEISTKNHIQSLRKLAIGVPFRPDWFGCVLEDGLVLLPSVNAWIVLMQRFDGSLNFNRNWTEYKNGFGDIGGGEFWLGNEKTHQLTNRTGLGYSLRIEVQLKTSGKWYYADYDTFSLESEDDKYALRLSGFSGTAGDSLNYTSRGSDSIHVGMSFSTSDSDNDRSYGNCAQTYRAGWWFNACEASCLTCPYNNIYFHWYSLDHLESYGKLRAARMMIKSK